MSASLDQSLFYIRPRSEDEARGSSTADMGPRLEPRLAQTSMVLMVHTNAVARLKPLSRLPKFILGIDAR